VTQSDSEAYRPGTERQHSWNLFHINALYDLESGIYTDVIVQKEHMKHESKALCQMTKRSGITGPVILLADRNYEAYNNFACLEQKGWKYLIRIKDHDRKNAYGIKLPDRPARPYDAGAADAAAAQAARALGSGTVLPGPEQRDL